MFFYNGKIYIIGFSNWVVFILVVRDGYIVYIGDDLFEVECILL